MEAADVHCYIWKEEHWVLALYSELYNVYKYITVC